MTIRSLSSRLCGSGTSRKSRTTSAARSILVRHRALAFRAIVDRTGISLAIESKSIDYVPETERHGRVSDQVSFWFLGNFHFFTIAIGFVGPSMGLSFGYTALAGTLGILFGTLFAAFHASQGAELGLPQMVQSRAQFGFRGVIVVLVGTLFTFIGFNVANSVLSAHGLNGILGWNERAVTVVTSVAAALLAIYGYDWLHRIFRWCFFVCLPLYAVLTVAIMLGKVPPTHFVVRWVLGGRVRRAIRRERELQHHLCAFGFGLLALSAAQHEPLFNHRSGVCRCRFLGRLADRGWRLASHAFGRFGRSCGAQ